jgi:hypothetical protein
MKKSLLVAALIAAACSTAFAGEVTKQTTAPAPVVKAQTMTDTDMDKVTAGSGAIVSGQGPGVTVDLPGRASDNAYGGGINQANGHAFPNPAHLCGVGCL